MLSLRNEFAAAVVDLDYSANGPRLRVTDVSSGAEIFLDPMELSGIARSKHAKLGALIFSEDYLVESDEWARHAH